MSKLMTLNMAFEALTDGRLTLDTPMTVSTRARKMGGSTMFLNEQDRPTVSDLIYGIIINSGNDACVVIAEGLAGTEDAFAALMTKRATTLGLSQSTFKNASGWPADGHQMSMEDLGKLALRLIEEFPQFYSFFSKKEFNYANRAPANRFNRNPLLKLNIGADGLKTGHTEEAGYGLVGSAVQDDRRVIVVLSGMGSEHNRSAEAEKIFNWAFRDFTIKTLLPAGKPVAQAEVWLGAQHSVNLVPAYDVRRLVPTEGATNLTAEVVYEGPVSAPIMAGMILGELNIFVPGFENSRVPLVAQTSVSVGGMFKRLETALNLLIYRFLLNDEGQ
jgi:D-alanyl-D-alanine carboxypeptidase (penicillin-binding protein 5/6)